MGAGLGNQMYEYAFYLQLKNLYPAQEIKVDTKYAFPYAHNGIELFNIFSIIPSTATKEEVLNLASRHILNGEGFQKKSILSKVIYHYRIYPKSMFVMNDYTEFYPELFRLSMTKSYYLFGPFANYRYFRDIKDTVISTYIFPEIKDNRNLAYKSQIENTNSVSIHIRKGDYVKEGITLTPKNFYDEAIRILESKENKLQYYIFTDDSQYARELFPDIDRFIVVEGNEGKNSFRDMQLMSMCRHNITANSTFSFWGAYLNRNPNKIVIAPNLPFTGLKYPFVCDDWITL